MINFILILSFSAWPFLTFMSGNLDEFINTGTILQIWGTSFALIALFHAAICLFVKNLEFRRKLLHSACVGFIVFFSFGFLGFLLREHFDVIRSRYILLVWAGVFVFSTILTWRLSRFPPSSRMLAIAGGAVALTAAIPVALSLINSIFPAQPRAHSAPAPSSLTDENYPSVYYFILDGYGRADQLKSDLKFNNTPFLDGMRQLGFQVLEKSTANFPITKFSISSTLSMDYVVKPGMASGKDYLKYQALLGGYNPVVQMFRNANYSYVHAPPGSWDATRCRGENVICIRAPKTGINETQASLLAATPMEILLLKFFPDKITHEISKLPYVMDQLLSIRQQISGPIFSFAHLMIPHDMVYNGNCKFIGRKHRFISFIPRGKEGHYIDTIKCLNEQLLKQIPQLLSSDPGSIIIIQSDHGYMQEDIFKMPFKEWPQEEIRTRYGILNMMLTPKKCHPLAYSDISAVNTFRLIKACIFDKAPDFLPDLNFFATSYGDKIMPLSGNND